LFCLTLSPRICALFDVFISGDLSVEEIHAFAKMQDKSKNKEKRVASTMKHLNHILAVAKKVEEDLQNMKSVILV
jgi:hypothetical protein